MIKTILLITPVFISIFWGITLHGDKKNQTIPRLMLGKFMILAFICFFSHFLYFSSAHYLFHFTDVLLTYAGNIGFPIYYIYFRLLTVDEKFTFKAHARYLIPSLILSTIYAVAVLLTPTNEYRTWLFDENAFPNSSYIHFLGIMRAIIRIFFLFVVSATYIANVLLLKKYGYKAEQYYSEINDGKYNNAKKLNYTILLLTIGSVVALVIGRQLILSKDAMIYILWTIFSTTLYYMGYMGLKQKAVNPTFDLDLEKGHMSKKITALSVAQQKILNKILLLFNCDKIHLNSQLTIQEIVNEVGTNRTYISAIINQSYNQNFCTFVNSYRIEELKKVLLNNPDYSNEVLAEYSGFGSVNSMKRSLYVKSNLSINDWKKKILLSQDKD